MSSPEGVRHEPSRDRFVLLLEDGSEAYLAYEKVGGALDFQHTWTPPQHRGKGLAEKVVRAGFAYARAHGLKVIPSCPYIPVYLRRHPEEKDLV